MHSHIQSESDQHHEDERSVIVVDLPPLGDEAAMQLSEVLKDISKQFDVCYRQQIRRAARARRKEEQRRIQELKFIAAQQVLPGFDAEHPF